MNKTHTNIKAGSLLQICCNNKRNCIILHERSSNRFDETEHISSISIEPKNNIVLLLQDITVQEQEEYESGKKFALKKVLYKKDICYLFVRTEDLVIG